jgi:hypothetical protein
MDLEALGERTITLDCDVIQADGGTRTAAITGGFVALADAVRHMTARRQVKKNPLHGQVASVSVGIYQGMPVLDLDYAEDSEAETDMNVVMNDAGAFIEIQGTAEGHAFRMEELQAMLELARGGIGQLLQKQREVRAAVHKLLRLGRQPGCQRRLCFKPLPRGVIAHFLGNLHRAEMRAAHRAEMRDLGRFLGQGFIVILAGAFRVETEVKLIFPAELEARF